MRSKFSILLSLLAWCCLVLPWQSCGSDCRNGALQPFGHGCHLAGMAEHHGCCGGGADHDAAGVVAAAAAADLVMVDLGAGRCTPRHPGDGDHHPVVFQQCAPERADDGAVLGGDEQERVLAAPIAAGTLAIAGCAPSVWPTASRPPDEEPQRMQQLRGDVLLI